ncbi:hypothetical protein KBD20_00935 [Candidatus Saccharibacteria bacterium]|nr:hypothetical protein [Candidatus Saccharibacteria bacterium]
MLDTYHQKYANQPDEELQRRLDEKEDELRRVQAKLELRFKSEVLDIAVMGCGDVRFVEGHKSIFTRVFNKPVCINTFDITTEHLDGAVGVYQHDCTLPLLFGPYDITFAHVLLRFIPKDKQWALIESSLSKLKPSGVAIHVLDPEDYQDTLNVDFPDLLKKAKAANVHYTLVDLSIGQALVLTV